MQPMSIISSEDVIAVDLLHVALFGVFLNLYAYLYLTPQMSLQLVENMTRYCDTNERQMQPMSIISSEDVIAVDLLTRDSPEPLGSAEQAIEERYLAPYHDPSDEPVAKEKFDWGFFGMVQGTAPR
jgi:hypothetical protein